MSQIWRAQDNFDCRQELRTAFCQQQLRMGLDKEESFCSVACMCITSWAHKCNGVGLITGQHLIAKLAHNGDMCAGQPCCRSLPMAQRLGLRLR